MLLVASIVLLVALLLVVVVIFGVREHLKGIDDRLRVDAIDRGAVTAKLVEIDELYASEQYRLAVIEADKLLHFVVKEMLYEGQSLEEHWDEVRHYERRFTGVPETYVYVQRLQRDAAKQVSSEEAQDAIDVYKKALHQLGLV